MELCACVCKCVCDSEFTPRSVNYDAYDDCDADDDDDDDSWIHSLALNAVVGCDDDAGDGDELAPSPGSHSRCSQAYCQLWVNLMWLIRCLGSPCFGLDYMVYALRLQADFFRSCYGQSS